MNNTKSLESAAECLYQEVAIAHGKPVADGVREMVGGAFMLMRMAAAKLGINEGVLKTETCRVLGEIGKISIQMAEAEVGGEKPQVGAN